MIGASRGKGVYVVDWPKPGHEGWEAFMEMERLRLQQHAQGKMALALGRALQGESQHELDRIALEDRRLIQPGMVRLKSGSSVYYKHIDELTRAHRASRIEAEWETVVWLKQRVERRKWGEDAPPIPRYLLG
jgi:hypothetical protein